MTPLVVPLLTTATGRRPALPACVGYALPPGPDPHQAAAAVTTCTVLVDAADVARVQAWLAPPPYDPATQRRDWRGPQQQWEVWDTAAYADLRAAAYPPWQDLADAVVKEGSADPAVRAAGQAQHARYVHACLAVKARYPKPGA